MIHENAGTASLTQARDVVFDNAAFATGYMAGTTSLNFVPFFQTQPCTSIYAVSIAPAGANPTAATPSTVDSDGDGFQVADGTTPPPYPIS